MPKFQKVRQNPPQSAKFRGMVHCICCVNSTSNPKFTWVHKNGRKGGKKASSVGGRGCGKHSASPQENQVTAGISPQGSESQPSGSGTQRCDSPGPTRCPETVLESECDSCPSWSQVRSYDPEFSDIQTEGVGEEWWEIVFEDIGIFPVIQPLYLKDHTYLLEEFQSSASSSDKVC